MKKLLIILIVLLCHKVSFSAEEDINAPHFRLQGVRGTNSGLSMWCAGHEPYNEMDCSFTQIFIHSTPSEITLTEKKNLVTEGNKLTNKDFDIIKETDKEKLSKKIDTSTREQKAYIQDSLKMIERLIKAQNKAQIINAMSDMIDFQGATCTISQQTFDRHFTKISKNKWIYNPGPVGLCNVVRIATLENTPEFPSLWTYIEKTEAFDNSDATCKEWVGNPKTFISSWDNPSGFKFDQCKYFQFGN
jgi:hypothetical protein